MNITNIARILCATVFEMLWEMHPDEPHLNEEFMFCLISFLHPLLVQEFSNTKRNTLLSPSTSTRSTLSDFESEINIRQETDYEVTRKHLLTMDLRTG